MKTLDILFPQFVEDRKYLNNVSKNTLSAYKSAWNAFGPYLKDVSEEAMIKPAIKEAIIAIQKEGRKREHPKGKRAIGDVSINNYLSVINAALNWGHEENHIDRLIRLPKLKTRKTVRTIITPAEIKKFQEFKPSGLQDIRLKTMILTCLDCGLRLMEVRKLKLGNIDLDNFQLTVHSGKGRKERIVPLSDLGRGALYKYKRDHSDLIVDGFLFGTKGKKLYNRQNVSRDMVKLCKRLGLRNITFHQLRHTFATTFLQRDGNVMKLRAILGHSSITTTQIYEHLTIEDLKKGFDGLSSLTRRMEDED